MAMLLALIAFSFVSSVTPGPNNVLLWASGGRFGFRATVRHVLGTALGIGGLALIVAAGLGTLVTAVPQVATVMKLAASAYLIYLAYRIARGGVLEQGSLARPMTLVQAVAFQAINPKAWVFALGAIAAFRPPELPVAVGSLLVAATMTVVVVPAAALWAAAGGSLSRFLAGERRGRIVSLVLGLMLAATVVYVWV